MTHPMSECTCPQQADECFDGVAIFYPLQDGGMCSTENCKKIQPLEHQLAQKKQQRKQLYDQRTRLL